MRTIYVSPDFPLNRRMRKDIRRGKLQVVREGGERLSLGGGIPSGKGRGFRTTGSPLVCMAKREAESDGLGGGRGKQEEPPTDFMGTDRLLRGLLQWNYFPRTSLDQVPPVFTTEDFTPDVARKIADVQWHKRNGNAEGFDCVGYSLARFNLVPRDLSIPHPAGYARLCLFLGKRWEDEISHICGNTYSVVVPREQEDGRIFDMQYGDIGEWDPDEDEWDTEEAEKMGYSVVRPRNHQDGRIVVMSYKSRKWEEHWMLDHSFGMRFLVTADIANFYPSVYTHAVGWAAVGMQEAKNQKSGWYDEWDRLQRMITRNETKGIPIGPGTSHIFSEFILQAVDEQLQNSFPSIRWRRAIDDYNLRFKEREEAEKFLRCLRVKLGKFGLHLNPRKTEILELPDHSDDSWMFAVETAAAGIDWNGVSPASLKKFLDYAASLAANFPHRSVLKYAVSRVLLKKIDKIEDDSKRQNACCAAIVCLINFAFHYPVLTSTLRLPFERLRQGEREDLLGMLWSQHKDKMLYMLVNGMNKGWSDVVSWVLYYYIFHDDEPETRITREVIDSGDCLPMALLLMMPSHRHQVQEHASELIRNHGEEPNCHELDRQWLLLYQVFREGGIENPYPASDPAAQCFEIMKKQGVNFLKIGDGSVHPSQEPEMPREEDPF